MNTLLKRSQHFVVILACTGSNISSSGFNKLSFVYIQHIRYLSECYVYVQFVLSVSAFSYL